MTCLPRVLESIPGWAPSGGLGWSRPCGTSELGLLQPRTTGEDLISLIKCVGRGQRVAFPHPQNPTGGRSSLPAILPGRRWDKPRQNKTVAKESKEGRFLALLLFRGRPRKAELRPGDVRGFPVPGAWLRQRWEGQGSGGYQWSHPASRWVWSCFSRRRGPCWSCSPVRRKQSGSARRLLVSLCVSVVNKQKRRWQRPGRYFRKHAPARLQCPAWGAAPAARSSSSSQAREAAVSSGPR